MVAPRGKPTPVASWGPISVVHRLDLGTTIPLRD
jgi:hypothetical protein